MGAGTDPQEGAALARVILSHLIERGGITFVATHYPELKTFAHTTDGVVNASLEFDIQTLRPTYRLTIGLPGRSNALLIAQRLGLDPQLVAAARSEINPDDLRADKLLDDIRKERNRTSREREKLEKARCQARYANPGAWQAAGEIEDERRDVLARARAEGELEVAVLRENIGALKAQLKKARQPLEALKEIEAAGGGHPGEDRSAGGTKAAAIGCEAILHQARRAGLPAFLELRRHRDGPWRIRCGSTDRDPARPGEVLGPAEKQRDRTQRWGAGRAHPRPEPEPSRSESQPAGRDAELRGRRSPIAASPGMEISLRGKLVEDGLDELDRYLEKAYAAGLPFVRIVHGKGTGRMREAVRARPERQSLRQLIRRGAGERRRRGRDHRPHGGQVVDASQDNRLAVWRGPSAIC